MAQVVEGRDEHEFEDLTQYVLEVHPVAPHRQAAELTVIPVVCAQGGPAAHVLVDLVQ